ncbi:hypothetical protein ScPMuIL_018378 [Solemya velum]
MSMTIFLCLEPNRQLDAAHSYNEELRKHIDDLSVQLHNYKKKCNGIHISTQTEVNRPVIFNIPIKKETIHVAVKQEPVENEEKDSVADGEIHEENTKPQEQLDGFVYDATSGLYYNYETCYYYNPGNGLFYDTSSGSYYYYDDESQTYKVYSETDVEIGHAETNQTEQVNREKGDTESSKQSSQQEMEDSGSALDTSIADALRCTAEAAVQQTGFVYDEATGLYYDHSTGYYYDSENCLYYDHSTGYYYYYNTDTNTYEYHSQADIIPPAHNTEKSPRLTHSSKKNGKKKSPDKKKKQVAAKDTIEELSSEIGKLRIQTTDQVVLGTIENIALLFQLLKKIEKNRLKKKQRKKKKFQTRRKLKEKVCDKNNIKIVPIRSELSGRDINSSSDNVCEYGAEKPDDDSYGELMETDNEIEIKKNDEIEPESGSASESESERESGELSDSELECTESESEEDDSSFEDGQSVDGCVEDFDQEMLQSYPPCIRVIVQESDCLEEGQLFIVTCEGTCVGRDITPSNGIVVPDINVSMTHAEFSYDETSDQYCIVDTGSISGTFVNGQRLSKTKKKSQPLVIHHGAILEVGGTKFLLHIHPGKDTCDLCEPGQIQAAIKSREAENNPVIFTTKEDKKKEFRKNLKTIKKKYGLENSAYEDNMKAINNSSYEDKASVRRKTVGSEHPAITEKTSAQPASVHREISADNMGHKLLKKMGWKEGESLGKDNKGITDPVQIKFRGNRAAGLGSKQALECSIENVHETLRNKKWIQAQQRFNKLQGPTLPE